jgi:hypothetical protein
MDEPANPKGIDRRDFLVTLILVPVGAKLAGCNAYGDGGSGGSCDGIESTSTVASGHTHTVCVPQSDLDSPPVAGRTYTTSSVGHTHTVTLSQADLGEIAAGGAVMVTTSLSNGHAHEFTISMA